MEEEEEESIRKYLIAPREKKKEDRMRDENP